jgi:hypothetical protein
LRAIAALSGAAEVTFFCDGNQISKLPDEHFDGLDGVSNVSGTNIA